MLAAAAPVRTVVVVSLFCWTIGAAAADDPAARFDAGVAAYRAGQLESALDDFLAARAAGLDSPQLQFDLALAYFRLGQDPAAQAEFERLKAFPDYADIADFHLALIAARQGRRAEAAQTLQRLGQSAAEPAVRERAQVALQRLGRNPGAAASGYVQGAAGYDSNPGQVDDTAQTRAKGSSFLDFFGSFDLPVASGDDAATHLRGGAFLHDYAQASGLNQRGLFGELGRDRSDDGRRGSWSLTAATHQLGGAHFIDTFTAAVAGEPQAGRSGLALRGQFSWINAAPAYAYLQGWRLRGEIERLGRAGRTRVRAGYQFEFNDRADLASGAEFFSHSPMRHRLGLTVERPVGEAWMLGGTARYRYSAYRDPNRFLDGGVLREQRRVENLLEAGVQLRRQLGETWGLLAEYQYSHNLARIAGFGYDRQVLSLGLEWMPHS